MPSWFAIRRDPPPGVSLVLKLLSFALPLGLWCYVSYVPGAWHPLVKITDPGDSFYKVTESLQPTVPVDVFERDNAKLTAAGERPMVGERVNPVFLPAPHEVVRSLYAAFTTPPRRQGDVWFHESLLHSLRLIALAFLFATVIGVPVGIFCGTFPAISRLIEPAVDFVRYMPPPVFGALAIAVVGMYDAPKIAIIVIGTLFPMVRVVANTTRQVDGGLLEAALTLGASRRRLLSGVILPGILPALYNDLRILLGCCWTLLTVSELIGLMTGLTLFIDRQGRYFRYDNVFAGIIVIGVLGMVVDKMLTMIGARLFPWQGKPAAGLWSEMWVLIRGGPKRFVATATPATTPAIGQDVRRADAAPT